MADQKRNPSSDPPSEGEPLPDLLHKAFHSSFLADLDAYAADDRAGARVVYRQRPAGSVIAGGGGGGKVLKDVWVHAQLQELGLESRIRKTLLKEKD